jgi:galactitol PTS system EIIA component
MFWLPIKTLQRNYLNPNLKNNGKYIMSENKWFYKENLLFPLVASTKEEAIEKLGGLLFKNGYVKETYVPAVRSREQEFATGLPTSVVGVAIPHTDSIHILKQAVAVGIMPNPVVFCEMGDPEDKPIDVRLIFMLAVPDKKKVMTVLQQVISIIQSQEFLKALISTTDREQLAATLDKHLNAAIAEKTEQEKSETGKSNIPEVKLVIQHEVGLHARPATLFVKLAKQFSSDIVISCNGKDANAKSILKILALGADKGTEITIRAEGDDANQALTALSELVESNFDGVA